MISKPITGRPTLQGGGSLKFSSNNGTVVSHQTLNITNQSDFDLFATDVTSLSITNVIDGVFELSRTTISLA